MYKHTVSITYTIGIYNSRILKNFEFLLINRLNYLGTPCVMFIEATPAK